MTGMPAVRAFLVNLPQLRPLTPVLVLAVLLAGACGTSEPPEPDGMAGNARLVVATPPGDALGLKYGDRVTLRVRYEDGNGQVLPSEPVAFALEASGADESTAGSTLSASSAVTDGLGIAQVELVAGAQNASFRVSVNARDARTQYFFVTISDGGFARLYVTPVHEGWRAPEELARVEVRLYRAASLTCTELDIDTLPLSLLAPRSLEGFGGTVNYQNIRAGEPHTLVAWTELGQGTTRVGAGCVELGARQLPNSRVNLTLPVRDRQLELQALALESRLELGPVEEAANARGAGRPWAVLGCGAGTGQLVLDCALDAAAPDGALDCAVGGAGALVQAVQAERGPVDAAGCRPAMLPGGARSLDGRLAEAVAASGRWPDADQQQALLGTRQELLGVLELGSELTGLTPGAVRHGLRTARVRTEAGEYELDLVSTSRPVLDQAPVPVTVNGRVAELGEHGFTLRLGSFLAAAFAELGLGPAGLGSRASTLGQALVEAVRIGTNDGCAAVSALVCTEIGRQPGCLEAACASGAAALDAQLTGWWRLFDGPGLDLALVGLVGLGDEDGDLVIDGIEAGDGAAEDSFWQGTLRLADGAAVIVDGAL